MTTSPNLSVAREGRMAWSDLIPQLAAATCLWQDLDGLHIEQAPAQAPSTSILWAWTADEFTLWRVRLDGDISYVAVHTPDPQTGVPLTHVPASHGAKAYGRFAQFRPARGTSAVLSAVRATQYVEPMRSDGIPVTFVSCRVLPA